MQHGAQGGRGQGRRGGPEENRGSAPEGCSTPRGATKSTRPKNAGNGAAPAPCSRAGLHTAPEGRRPAPPEKGARRRGKAGAS